MSPFATRLLNRLPGAPIGGQRKPKLRPRPLSLVELESRDTPSLFAVRLISPPAGELGDTGAKHSGALAYRSGLATADGGGVQIQAASAAEAVRAALTGSITVTVGKASSTVTFGPTTAGTADAHHKPFVVRTAGGVGLIQLEDLAGFTNTTPDWDYNDRSWHVAAYQVGTGGPPAVGGGGVTALSGPQNGETVIDSYTFTLGDQFYQTATVDYTVWEYAPDVWQWEYVVTNNSINNHAGKSNSGMRSFSIEADPAAGVYDAQTSLYPAWDGSKTAPGWGVTLYYPTSGLMPGNTATFTFKTAPRPIVPLPAAAGGGGMIPTIAEGQVKGPGVAKVQILDAGRADADHLKVAKWQNAFELGQLPTGEPKVNVKANFIDLDPDRYYVRVTDASKNSDSNSKQAVTVKLFTTSDTGSTISLTETGDDTGVFESKSLMLMSNRVDDEHKVDGVTDNNPDDRTHLVRLTDVVTAEYKVLAAGNAAIRDTADVPIKHIVKLNTKIVRLAGDPVATNAQVSEQITRANEQMAQAQIRLVASPAIRAIDPPAGVDLGNGLQTRADECAPVGGMLPMSQEELDLLVDAAGTIQLRTPRNDSQDDVELYYVNYLAQNDGKPSNAIARAIYEKQAIAPSKADSVIMPNDFSWLFILPHEIAHTLMNSGIHAEDESAQELPVPQTNIMLGTVAVAEGKGKVDIVTAPKRFTDQQVTRAQYGLYTGRPSLLSRFHNHRLT
ncbi:MAG: hypothetical protein U0871_26630 [Gemmataceae bacterium]